MSDSSLSYVCEKEEVGKEDGETISGLPKRGQVKLLTIDWGTFFLGYGTFGKLINSSIFYCCFFVEEISVNIAEKQAVEDKDPNIE